MIFVLSKNLKPGMTLARDVWGRNSFIPLVYAGNKLTQKAINSFIKKDIMGVYIKCANDDTMEIQEILPMEIKVRITAEIEKIFKQLENEKGSVFRCVKSLNHVADYLVEVITETSDCMMNMIDIKNYNEYAYVHSMQVAIMCTLIGKKLNYSNAKLKEIAIAGMLHDLGKIGIPLEILDKKGALTSEEFDIMKQHPKLGLIRLGSCNSLSGNILDGIIHHHEKIDGTGYPSYLNGNQISEFGKVIAIADVFDALTSNRSYRNTWEIHTAIEYMISCSDAHFDVDLLTTFLSVVAAYPIGVLVILNNGLNAVVVDTVEGLPLNPIVKILTPGDQYGKILNLANDREALTIQIVDTLKDEKIIEEIISR